MVRYKTSAPPRFEHALVSLGRSVAISAALTWLRCVPPRLVETPLTKLTCANPPTGEAHTPTSHLPRVDTPYASLLRAGGGDPVRLLITIHSLHSSSHMRIHFDSSATGPMSQGMEPDPVASNLMCVSYLDIRDGASGSPPTTGV